MKILTTTIKMLAGTAAMAAVVLLYTPDLHAAPATGLTPATGEGAQGKHERHPHIRAAIHELREAAREMKEAAHDFGGHREEALKATDVAIEQLKICLESVPKAGAGKAGHVAGAGVGAGTAKAGKAETAGAVKGGQGEGERHPHIHAAIRELHEAARELKEAAHDFSGHREDALKATDNAIEQLRKALEFDKK
jgi:hypothetical protein